MENHTRSDTPHHHPRCHLLPVSPKKLAQVLEENHSPFTIAVRSCSHHLPRTTFKPTREKKRENESVQVLRSYHSPRVARSLPTTSHVPPHFKVSLGRHQSLKKEMENHTRSDTPHHHPRCHLLPANETNQHSPRR